MQPLRLLVVATAMVAVLALVAGLAATSDRVDQVLTETETRPAAPATAPPRDLSAVVPAKKPIVMRVGDTVTLNVTLPEQDTLTVQAFGLDETIAQEVPTPVLVTALTTGRYPLLLQDSGKSVGELVVKPALPATGTPAAPQERTDPAPATAAQATAR